MQSDDLELIIRQAAAALGVDPRSVKKVLDGGQVRGLAGARARQAAARVRSMTDATPRAVA
ncbi:MAG: hypothetical protein HYV09_18035 [Deltaproteobacteria bacterium]|nr:hypothetical protein [Deltaproteobacteria bacterium]